MTPSELNRFLQEWDNGSKSKRVKILEAFINMHRGKIAAELEQVYNNGASLFFTRLTSWLRISYMNGYYVDKQLMAILIFVGSSSGHKFLTEFIEVGGILTVLEILGLNQLGENDKKVALELINVIAVNGRKYKELICESFGIKAIAQCLTKCESIDCQNACKIILKELSVGNPKYLHQIYKVMIALLKSLSPEAQRIAAQILQLIQPKMDNASIGIVDPALMLLRSLHLEVQYEGFQLITILMMYENIKLGILTGLVGSLKPSQVDFDEQPEILKDPVAPEIQAPLPVYIQQAAAAKLIRKLADESNEVAEQCIQLNCIHNLLYAMGNENYADSQKQAGITLQFFIHSFQSVEAKVRDALGQTFFFEFMNNPDSFFLNLTPINVDILLGNKVNVSQLT